MNIPIKTLHCFLRLVEIGNFTRAAEQLYLTQPTLSKMIQRLEETLDQQLLIRSNQKVELTQAGQIFHASASQIIGQWHRMEQDLANLSGLKSGHLRLGVCPMMSTLTIDLLTKFRQTYPGVELHMQEYGGFGCEQALLADSLDIAFTALPVTNSEQLSASPLQGYPLKVCLPNEHPLTAKERINWQDLAQYPFILYNEDFSLAKLFARLTKEAGVTLNIAFRSGQWDFLGAMVEEGMGLAILPEPICNKLDKTRLVFRPMEKELFWQIGLIWRNNLPLTPAAEALLALSRHRP
ncbi:LysR family transcriptional regulator [Shewanella dokdonensis]|uniref:LysR family transcriptional regulator n=1 Tax=Shewanella dokdonensis TaxID=712036 RepID=A0ABX8DC73_9GAMM|nr:LysR family transcriptional regulator [Shewanella dokdonensis]MCL1074595.1 LysR family transcriptional regulator [Shewanella dokdonensis]QVK22394.1 LysR family transcriptional regulator [Shewanella dokdonensis]